MIDSLLSVIKSLFDWRPIRLTIVRRYADANGNYIGELYLRIGQSAVSANTMIGVSLDSLPLELSRPIDAWGLIDTRQDFLFPMLYPAIRVGAVEPKDNDAVRRLVGRLPQMNMTIEVQNKFIEHVLSKKLA